MSIRRQFNRKNQLNEDQNRSSERSTVIWLDFLGPCGNMKADFLESETIRL